MATATRRKPATTLQHVSDDQAVKDAQATLRSLQQAAKAIEKEISDYQHPPIDDRSPTGRQLTAARMKLKRIRQQRQEARRRFATIKEFLRHAVITTDADRRKLEQKRAELPKLSDDHARLDREEHDCTQQVIRLRTAAEREAKASQLREAVRIAEGGNVQIVDTKAEIASRKLKLKQLRPAIKQAEADYNGALSAARSRLQRSQRGRLLEIARQIEQALDQLQAAEQQYDQFRQRLTVAGAPAVGGGLINCGFLKRSLDYKQYPELKAWRERLAGLLK
jgi:DNA repair exonuclease SbcCD ATPase subunit